MSALNGLDRYPFIYGLRLAALACQRCGTVPKPGDKIVCPPDGWILCLKCDRCPTCAKRFRDYECTR